jgi:hypothetical protein
MRLPNPSPTRRNRRRTVVIGATAALTVPLVGAVAGAAVPDTQGVFHGCYVKTTGALRVIDPSSTNAARNRCKATEAAITWNQRGPQGPQGVQGPQGLSGSGLTGVETQTFPDYYQPYERRAQSVACSGDKIALAGGFSVSQYNGSDVTLLSSAPESIHGWSFVIDGGQTGAGVTFVLTCADGTP